MRSPADTWILGRRRACAWLVIAAGLATTACAEVGKYTVRFEADELRRARQRARDSDVDTAIDTDGGKVLSTAYLRVTETRPDGGKAVRWTNPVTFVSGLPAGDGGATLVVVERRRGEAKKNLVDGGKYTAVAGGAVAGAGLLFAIGAVLVAGPANDTRRFAYGGAITLGVGATVALVGGTVALVGIAPTIEPGVPTEPVDLGRARVR